MNHSGLPAHSAVNRWLGIRLCGPCSGHVSPMQRETAECHPVEAHNVVAVFPGHVHSRHE